MLPIRCIRILLTLILGAGPGLLISVLAIEAEKAVIDEWPNWRGPNHDGISREKNLILNWDANGPKVLWKISIGTGFSSFTAASGRLYTMGNANEHDHVYCIDQLTGDIRWTSKYPAELDPKSYEGGPNATPTIDGGYVYTLGKKGEVFCLNGETGDVVWSNLLEKTTGIEPPKWGFAGSPLIVGNLVILNIGDRGTALNKRTGAIVWKSGRDGAGYSTPVPFQIGGSRGVAIFSARGIYGVNPINGDTLWNYKWKTSWDVNAADPIIDGNRIFISSAYNSGSVLLAVDDGRVSEVWSNRDFGNHFNSSVLWNGYVYGFDGHANRASKLKCIDFRTGRLQWENKNFGFGSILLADGKLIILTDRGELITAEANPTRYIEIARAQILGGRCWTVPLICGGRIYARNAKSDVVCLHVGPSQPSAGE